MNVRMCVCGVCMHVLVHVWCVHRGLVFVHMYTVCVCGSGGVRNVCDVCACTHMHMVCVVCIHVCACVYIGVTYVHTHMHTVFMKRAALNEDVLSSHYCCLETTELTLGLWGCGQREHLQTPQGKAEGPFFLEPPSVSWAIAWPL